MNCTVQYLAHRPREVAMATRARQAGAAKKGAATQPPKRPDAAPRTLRSAFGLSLTDFSRMTGVPEADLAKWEQGAYPLQVSDRGRIEGVGRILEGLARVMRKAFLPTWLGQPNDACKEAGVPTPLALLERGGYQQVEDMIYYFESGVPI